MDEIYSERVPFTIGKVVVLLIVALSAVFLGLFLYQLLGSPVGERPAPDWYYLIMFLVFCVISVVLFNLRELTVRATAEAITIAYGIIKYTISWDNITGCYLDESQTISYGGWGIRIGMKNGRSVLVYNVIGSPRVVLELNKGRFAQFAFSTRHLEEIMALVQERTRG